MNRDELVSALVPPGCDPAVFDGWEMIPGFVKGQHVCTAALKGREIHFAVLKEHQKKVIRRDAAREFLGSILKEKGGFLTTRVLLEHKPEIAFVERIGFRRTWSCVNFQYFFLTELPFERAAHVC